MQHDGDIRCFECGRAILWAEGATTEVRIHAGRVRCSGCAHIERTVGLTVALVLGYVALLATAAGAVIVGVIALIRWCVQVMM